MLGSPSFWSSRAPSTPAIADSGITTSDGVETELSTQTLRACPIHAAVAPLQFFDDAGNVAVQFETYQVIRGLIVPLLEPDTDGTYDTDPPVGELDYEDFLVFSPDGIEWRILWQSDGALGAYLGTVAVGDDEVIFASSGEIVRIPLDE